MKSTIKKAFAIIVLQTFLAAALYGLGVFITLKPDLTTWPYEGRAVIAIIWMVSLITSIGASVNE